MLTNFDSRTTYFDGLGRKVKGAQKTDVVIELAGLDYEVEKRPIFLEDGTKIEGKFATVRTDNNGILGVVGNNYEVVQNREGFAFVDSIIEGGADFEVAGSYKDGKGAFMVANTKPINILGDEFAPYILFTNAHDGSGAVKAMFTPIRVVCQNTFVLAERQASVKISLKHSKSVKSKLEMAKEVLLANTRYLTHLKEKAELLAETKFTKKEYSELVNELAKINPEDEKVGVHKETIVADLMKAYNAPDIQKFKGTAWQAIQAISDYESHRDPLRKTGNNEIYMDRVLKGMVLLNTALKIIARNKKLNALTRYM